MSKKHIILSTIILICVSVTLFVCYNNDDNFEVVINENGGADFIKENSNIDFLDIDNVVAGLYYHDDSKTYFFRGNVTDNYIYFADLYWQIISVTEDGFIKLIYYGEDLSAATPAFNSNYESVYQNLYNWYEEEIIDTNFEDYIYDNNYCIDSSKYRNEDDYINNTLYIDDELSYNSGSMYQLGGYSYGDEYPYLNENLTINFKCENDDQLKYPISLITAQEVVAAGILNYYVNNDGISKNYLLSDFNYWTSDLFGYYQTSDSLNYFMVDSTGYLNAENSNEQIGVRPVITLTNDININYKDSLYIVKY